MTTTADEVMRLADEYASEAMGGGYPDDDESTRLSLRAAVESLVAERDALKTALVFARVELDGLPRSLGYEFTHLPALDAALRGQP